MFYSPRNRGNLDRFYRFRSRSISAAQAPSPALYPQILQGKHYAWVVVFIHVSSRNQIEAQTLAVELDRLHAVPGGRSCPPDGAGGPGLLRSLDFRCPRAGQQRHGCLKASGSWRRDGRIRCRRRDFRRVKHCAGEDWAVRCRSSGRHVPRRWTACMGWRLDVGLGGDGSGIRALWNELTRQREHPRGAGPLVRCSIGTARVVGTSGAPLRWAGLGFRACGVAVCGTGTAGSDGMRNNAGRTCTGWSGAEPQFLIRPSVRCRNLASRVLGRRCCWPGSGRSPGALRLPHPLVETFERLPPRWGQFARPWRVLGSSDAGSRPARSASHRGAETSKASMGMSLCRELAKKSGGWGWDRRRGGEWNRSSEGEGLDPGLRLSRSSGWAPVPSRRLSFARNWWSVQPRLTQDRGGRSRWSGAGRSGGGRPIPPSLIDQPEASEGDGRPTSWAPHRERTRQRMQGPRTVLCIQDGSDLNRTRHGRSMRDW